MNPDFDEICARIIRARVTFVQALNAIAMTFVGAAVVVNLTYGDVLRQLLSKMPPIPAAIALFAFGALVHIGLRAAKKAAQ